MVHGIKLQAFKLPRHTASRMGSAEARGLLNGHGAMLRSRAASQPQRNPNTLFFSIA